MDKTGKRLSILAVFTFFVSPVFVWLSILASDESAVYASLSRMIWFTGSSERIFIAMLSLFMPMLCSFFLAHDVCGMAKRRKTFLRIFMGFSCSVLYIGAMWVIPSDGKSMTTANIWHGILSFGGMLMIFLAYCLYVAYIFRLDRDGAGLLSAFLVFSIISGAFAVLNVFDEKSYVTASAVSELYFLIMMSLTGYMTYYLAYRHRKSSDRSEEE